MGRWGVVVIAGMCALGSAGCHGHSRTAAPTSSSRPKIAGVSFPEPAPVDPGVLHDLGPAKAERSFEEPDKDPKGLRAALELCELRAPGERLVRGRVTLPAGKRYVRATVSLGVTVGDLGYGSWSHRVEFAKSGRFAVVMRSQETRSGDRRDPLDDGGDSCSMSISSASVPIADESTYVFVDATTTAEPFVYSAPADSIQALGIGAPLGEQQDPRTISLYTAWAGEKSAITKVWVPVADGERAALLSVKPSNPSCTTISVGIGPADGQPAQQVTVTTRMSCGAPEDDEHQSVVDTKQPVAGASGFTWFRFADHETPEMARRTVGPYEVWVQGGRSVTRDRIARIAATLTTRRNLATTGHPPPARPATLDAVIAGYLAEHKGQHERARFHYRDGWMIFFDFVQRGGQWNYRMVRAGEIAGGWWIDASNAGGGGTKERCFEGPGVSSSADGDRFAWAITGDPHWTIEGLFDGQWRTVPTINGVLFVDGTVPDPTRFPGKPRPIDATGHVPACFLADRPNG